MQQALGMVGKQCFDNVTWHLGTLVDVYVNNICAKLNFTDDKHPNVDLLLYAWWIL